jgi:heme oxygenase
MLARLARSTSSHHPAIDEAVMAVADEPTLASYRYLLARLYGFDAPLLASLLVTPGLDLSLVADRPRASDLANDLLALGITASEAQMLQRRHEVPRFACVAEAVGWMYASERITLCHPMIRARLRAAIPAALKVAGTYLGRTRTPHVAWNQLGRFLDRTASCEVVAEQILEAAEVALASQRRWFEATAWGEASARE